MKRCTLLLTLALAPFAFAQPDAATKHELVDTLAQLLRDRYVFADVGAKAAEHIEQRLKDGAYETATDEELAKRLTADLQSVAHDKHLHVDLASSAGARFLSGADPGRLRAMNFGFEKLEHLRGNVGYLKLNLFGDLDSARELAVSAMRFLANSDAIIIDLRDNGGGRPEMVTFLAGYFFDKPLHLYDIYRRAGDTTQPFTTAGTVEGKRLPDVPLFILTSAHTFSAAEGFSYHLQAFHRATIVGEVTGGGANPAEYDPLGYGFMASIPNGRSINAITKTNWEGTGVKPDVLVPADKAFDAAYERALSAASRPPSPAGAHPRESAPSTSRS